MTPNEFQPEDSQTPLATREPLAAPARLQGAELQTFLRRKLNRLKTRTNRYIAGKFASILSGILWTLVMGIHGSYFGAFCCLFVLPFLLHGALVGYHNLTRKAVEAELEDMAREAGTQAIGTLFEMLAITLEPKITTAIYRILARLLPQMKASDANLLTPAARRTMRGWLNAFSVTVGANWRLNDLRVASLQALEHVGESRDIRVVERLTEMRLRECKELKVQQAAIHCLPILKANCADVATARTLLRASQAEPAGADTLLRPASGAGQTDSAELLRGAEPPEILE